MNSRRTMGPEMEAAFDAQASFAEAASGESVANALVGAGVLDRANAVFVGESIEDLAQVEQIYVVNAKMLLDSGHSLRDVLCSLHRDSLRLGYSIREAQDTARMGTV